MNILITLLEALLRALIRIITSRNNLSRFEQMVVIAAILTLVAIVVVAAAVQT